MKKLLLVILGIVVGVGASFFWISQREANSGSSITGPIQYTCELSGGVFENGVLCMSNRRTTRTDPRNDV